MSWEKVERELGVKGPVEAAEVISKMWGVIGKARSLVRWWNDPDRYHPTQGKYVAQGIADRETALRGVLEVLDGPESRYKP